MKSLLNIIAYTHLYLKHLKIQPLGTALGKVNKLVKKKKKKSPGIPVYLCYWAAVTGMHAGRTWF